MPMSPTLMVPRDDTLWTPILLGTAVKGWFRNDSLYETYSADPADESAEKINVVRNLAPSATWHADLLSGDDTTAPTVTLTAGGKALMAGNGTSRAIGKNANADYTSTATAGFLSVIFSSNATTSTRCPFWISSTSGTRYLGLGYTPSGALGLLIQNAGSTYYGSSDVAAANSVLHQVSIYQDGSSGIRLFTGTAGAASVEKSITWTSDPGATWWFNSYTTTKPTRYSFLALISGATFATYANHNFGESIHVEGTVSAGDLTNLLSYLDYRRTVYYA